MGRKLVITLLVICLVLLGLWWVDHTRQASKALPVYSGPVEGFEAHNRRSDTRRAAGRREERHLDRRATASVG